MSNDREAEESQWWEVGSPAAPTPPEHPSALTPAPPLRQAPSAAVSPPNWSAPREKRFYAVAQIIAVPVFASFSTIVAVNAIPDSGARILGIGAAIFGLLIVTMGIRYPYVASVAPDGTLTFKALSGSTTTTASSVRRISVRTSGRGGSTWYFDYGTGRAHLSDLGGRALARYLVQCNPGIDCPPRLLRWAPPL